MDHYISDFLMIIKNDKYIDLYLRILCRHFDERAHGVQTCLNAPRACKYISRAYIYLLRSCRLRLKIALAFSPLLSPSKRTKVIGKGISSRVVRSRFIASPAKNHGLLVYSSSLRNLDPSLVELYRAGSL